MSRRLRFRLRRRSRVVAAGIRSMFDDLDSEDSAVSAPARPAAEGVQGTMDEQLIRRVLQEAEKSGDKESGEEESGNEESCREGSPADSGAGSTPESAEAEATSDLSEDSVEGAPASAASEPAEAPVAIRRKMRRRCSAPRTMRRKSALFRTPVAHPEAGCSAAAGCHLREPVDLKTSLPRACCTRLHTPRHHSVILRNISRGNTYGCTVRRCTERRLL